MATATLRPNATGTNNAWTANGAATNWECVDEASADDDTTYASNNDTSSPYDKLTVGLDAMPEAPSTVSSVIFHYRTKSASGTPSFVPVVRINGADVEGTAHNITNAYADYSWDITSQTTWTETLLNSLEVGGRKNTAATNTFRLTQAWVVVTYVVPATRTVPASAVLAFARTVPASASLALTIIPSIERTDVTVTQTFTTPTQSSVYLTYIEALSAGGLVDVAIQLTDGEGGAWRTTLGFVTDSADSSTIMFYEIPFPSAFDWRAVLTVTGTATCGVLRLPTSGNEF